MWRRALEKKGLNDSLAPYQMIMMIPCVIRLMDLLYINTYNAEATFVQITRM